MRRLWQALLSMLAALVCAELIARAAGWGEPPAAARRIEPEGFSPFVRDGDGPLSYRPGARFAFVYDTLTSRPYLGPDGRVEYRINSLGLRGEEVSPEKPSNLYRALCIGDSITFGEGVHEQDTYSAKLVGHLEARLGREVEVVTVGSAGPPPPLSDVMSMKLTLLNTWLAALVSVSRPSFTVTVLVPSTQRFADVGLPLTVSTPSTLNRYA